MPEESRERRSEEERDDALRPRTDDREARWQEAAAGEEGQAGESVTGTVGPAGAGMGTDTTQQPDPSRDRFRDLNQS